MTQTLFATDHDARIAEIADNLERLFEPGQVVELRVLGGGRALSGFFDDRQAMAAHALAAELQGANVYFGLAPRIPRRCIPDNELSPGKAAGEQDVLVRRWLLLDFDPVRPADTPSTRSEKKAALRVMEACIGWLAKEQGWPTPLIGNSGNGWHALYRVDLPTDDGGLVQRVLAALAAKFDTPEARIDQRVFDPPRIARLYGTTNCKGEPTPERPHRRSRLVGTGKATPVPLSKLEAVAGPPPAPAKSNAPARQRTNDEDEREEDSDEDSPAPDRETVVRLARRWLKEQDEAIAGTENGSERKGHDQTLYVSTELQRGWGLTPEETWELLEWYNEHRCRPEWSEKELRHKLGEGTAKAAESEAENPGLTGWRARKGTKRRKDKPEGERGGQSEAKALVAFVKERAELWHTAAWDPYATVPVGQHRETYALAEGGFERWLVQSWVTLTGDPPRKAAREEAIDSLVCIALATGPEYPAFIRIGRDELGVVYIDLADQDWRAVRIDAKGWSVIGDPPVRFVRTPFLAPLPEPTPGGSLDLLRPFVNVSDDEWPLYVACLVGFLRPDRTYPLLVVNGPQGSGKTVLTKQTQLLIDPCNVEPQTGVLDRADDLLLVAEQSWLQAYNNTSTLDQDQSDLLCCLVEGTTRPKRTHYKNRDLTLVKARRPAILNGISNVVVRGDLLSRTLLLNLVPPDRRRTEDELWSEFEAVRPLVLGALYDAVACALANLPHTTIEDPPRLHDFARWATAAEPKLGFTKGTVLTALRTNRQAASEEATQASPITPWLRLLLNERTDRFWKGTATELFQALNKKARDGGLPIGVVPGWPKTESQLMGILNRLKPDLDPIGIHLNSGKTGGSRWVSLRYEPKQQAQVHAPLGEAADAAGPPVPSGASDRTDAAGFVCEADEEARRERLRREQTRAR
jgi:hypothetical protein